ncbi:MAG TPA: hypothetical protein DD727_08610 [Clostridiales bacterium]|nr:hypothetical protein [Clostridiales bacterium]
MMSATSSGVSKKESPESGWLPVSPVSGISAAVEAKAVVFAAVVAAGLAVVAATVAFVVVFSVAVGCFFAQPPRFRTVNTARTSETDRIRANLDFMQNTPF